MHTLHLKHLVLVVLLAVILAACSAPLTATVQPAVEVQPTPTTPVAAPTATDAPTVAAPTEVPTEVPTEIPVNDGAVSFSEDVMPILKASCVSCHGSSRQSGGLVVNTYAALMAGAEGEAVLIPNDAAASILVQMITSGEMPKKDTKLSDADVQLISDWINAGALDN